MVMGTCIQVQNSTHLSSTKASPAQCPTCSTWPISRSLVYGDACSVAATCDAVKWLALEFYVEGRKKNISASH